MFLSLNLLCGPYSLSPKHTPPTAEGGSPVGNTRPLNSVLVVLCAGVSFVPRAQEPSSLTPALGAPGFPALPALTLGLGL